MSVSLDAISAWCFLIGTLFFFIGTVINRALVGWMCLIGTSLFLISTVINVVRAMGWWS